MSLTHQLRDVPQGDARPLYFDAMEEAADALERLENWLRSIVGSDWSEVVADGGVTAAMVIQQEAREQLRRLRCGEGIPNYCRPCGENLLPEQVDCPFCGQVSVPIDDRAAVTELVHELRYIESVYRQNCVAPGEPSLALDGVQKLLAKYEAIK